MGQKSLTSLGHLWGAIVEGGRRGVGGVFAELVDGRDWPSGRPDGDRADLMAEAAQWVRARRP